MCADPWQQLNSSIDAIRNTLHHPVSGIALFRFIIIF